MKHFIHFVEPSFGKISIEKPFGFNADSMQHNETTFIEIRDNNKEALDALIKATDTHGFEAEMYYIFTTPQGEVSCPIDRISTDTKTYFNFYVNDHSPDRTI